MLDGEWTLFICQSFDGRGAMLRKVVKSPDMLILFWGVQRRSPRDRRLP